MDALAKLLSSRVKAEVFRLLFAPGQPELHVREIARQAGLNDATVRQELSRLSGLHLVAKRRDGNRAYYRANTAHPLYPDIRSLVLKTSGVVGALRTALEGADARAAFVFGSVASGGENAGSDIDLLVIGPLSLRQVSKRLASARLDREINPYVLAPDEFAARLKRRDHFLTSVLGTPRLFVVGDEHELARLGQ
jgi:DNA-binding transcriptional ArsR family regulator